MPPADDVSDLRDVVDAINRLCDTMKTSQYDDVADDEPEESRPPDAEAGSRSVDSDTFCSMESLVSFRESEAALRSAGSEAALRSVESEAALRSVEPEVTFRSVELEATISSIEPEASAADSTATSRSVEPEAIFQSVESAASFHESEATFHESEATFRPIEPCDSVEEPEVAADMVGCVEARAGEAQERWSDSLASDAEAEAAPPSELYYTASSEVSLTSEAEGALVAAGHVAALRERFESLTRAATPCPDPDAARLTPDPDRLG